MKKCLIVITGVIFALYSITYAGVVFEDPFDDASKWVKIYGTPTANASGGWFNVKSAGNAQTLYNHSTVFNGDFTYSVKLKINSANTQGVGILFCWQSNFQGYMLYITGTRQYTFGKWVNTGGSISFVPLAIQWSSFAGLTDNVIKVSKKGNEIVLACNGHLFQKVTNADFPSGSIGLFVGTNEDVSFDHATVTDQFEDIAPTTYFADKFGDNNTNGWAKLQNTNGTVTSTGGVLQITNVPTQLIFYTSGVYKTEPCTSTVTFKSGDKSKIYGITYCVIDTPSVSRYSFVINGNREFAVITGGSYTLTGNSNITGVTDQLIVTKDYKFMVNGQIIYDQPISTAPAFNAVGYVVGPGVNIDCDNFSVGTYNSSPIIHNPHIAPTAKIKKNYLLGGSGLIYDIRGRQVASFTKGEYNDKIKNLGSGPYYVIMKGKKNHLIRRAVVNIK